MSKVLLYLLNNLLRRSNQWNLELNDLNDNIKSSNSTINNSNLGIEGYDLRLK